MIGHAFFLFHFPFWEFSLFSEPKLKVVDNVAEVGNGFPCVVFVRVIFPFDQVVGFIYVSCCLLSMTASSRMVYTS